MESCSLHDTFHSLLNHHLICFFLKSSASFGTGPHVILPEVMFPPSLTRMASIQGLLKKAASGVLVTREARRTAQYASPLSWPAALPAETARLGAPGLGG